MAYIAAFVVAFAVTALAVIVSRLLRDVPRGRHHTASWVAVGLGLVVGSPALIALVVLG